MAGVVQYLVKSASVTPWVAGVLLGSVRGRHYMKRILMAVACSACLLVTSLAALAGVPKGVRVHTTSATLYSFTYVPVVNAWESVIIDGRTMARPDIVGARQHQNIDGTVVQWVVRFDVVIPSAHGFEVTRSSIQTTTTPRLLAPIESARSFSGSMPEPLAENGVSVRYAGIARDQHIAEVNIVVAETRNGVTKMMRQADVAIALKPQTKAPLLLSKQGYEEVQAEGEMLQNVYRITVDKQGMYRLTADELRKNNIPTDAAAARTLKVFGRGGTELPEHVDSALKNSLAEQDIIVRLNEDGSVLDVLFYASGPTGFAWNGKRMSHYISHYATQAGYLLTWGGSDGKRAQMRTVPSVEPTQRPSRVTGRVFLEEEVSSPYNSGSGRRWFGRGVENPGSMSITTILPGVLQSSTVLYRFSLVNRGSQTGVFTISENGSVFVQKNVSPVPEYMDAYNDTTSAVIDATRLPSDGRSALRLQYESSDQSASGALDWFEIHYPRALSASDGEFEFSTESDLRGPTQYDVFGFSGDIYGFDITNKARPELLGNAANTGGMFAVRTILDSTSPRHYFLTSNVRTATLDRIVFSNLRTKPGNSDIIVVTHPSLIASAEAYAAYRNAGGELSATVVTTEQITNEFSYGVLDPTAMRDYLSHALSTWTKKPRYVLLWGDGHFDYKNISTSQVNFIPPYESLDPYNVPYGLSTFTTDDYFARAVGEDDRIDLSIGRMPITSNDVGNAMLAKIQRYEHNTSTDDWRTRVTMIADDGPTSNGNSDGALHLNQSEELAESYVPREIQSKKVYMVEYPTENIARGRRKPGVNDEILSTVNTSGTLLLNWIGHGNPKVWAHENIFVNTTTPVLMTNEAKPFFLTAATCDFARFDMVESQSGAEDLVLLPNSGAIGVFSSSRVVFSVANAQITKQLYTNIFTRGADGRFPRLGDAMYSMKQTFTSSNDQKFFLLGDPTVRLCIPDRSVVFESINGTQLSDTTNVTLKALSTVTVNGRCTKLGSMEVDSEFNGVATVSLFDATVDVTVIDTDKAHTQNDFRRRGAALSRGSYKVVDGRFTATFVVPKDIGFSSSNATLFGYAVGDSTRFAMGATEDLVVDGVDTAQFTDVAGPEIAVYMDSRKFIPGGLVRTDPILIVDLKDATGINTTGIGIGHDLEASFDEGALIENLTATFSTALEDSRAGTAEKQIFGLQPGHHTVRVRAWDVLNNFTEATTTFRVADSSAGIVTEGISNHPNPFASSTTIRFTHNMSQPFDAALKIFDIQGRMVFEQPMRIADRQTAELTWDAADTGGDLLGTGVYLCVVRIKTDDGLVHDVSGKLSLIR